MFSHPDPVSPEVLLSGEEGVSLYSGVHKRLAVSRCDGLSSVLHEQLSLDRDSDSLTTSPSSSSLDTYSSHKLFRAFSKSSSSQGLEPSMGPGGAVSGLDAGSGSSFSEADGEVEPRLSRSVTDGEMRRALNPSNYHVVSAATEFILDLIYLNCIINYILFYFICHVPG